LSGAPADVARLRTELIAYLNRRGAAPEDAEDAVQDGFARFFRAGHDVGSPDARPLLFVICRNLLLDRRRSAGREAVVRAPLSPDDIDEAGVAAVSEEPAADRAVAARQDLTLAAEIIRALPPKSRDAFLLHRFEDMTYRQIADRMGVSVSMVEKHLAEALRRLKTAVDR
jgi:RNA polymerase sigma factor (sigma-70 family)